jgi:hypothetical protein
MIYTQHGGTENTEDTEKNNTRGKIVASWKYQCMQSSKETDRMSRRHGIFIFSSSAPSVLGVDV